MSTTRRFLVLVALTLAVIVGSGIPASASFTESAPVPPVSIAAGTVQPPSALVVGDTCITTTTTTKRTVRTDPVTGVQTTTNHPATTSTATSTSNVQSNSTTSAPGPGAYETTYTTVAKNTNLHVTLSWTASPTARVTGYLVSAHLGINSSVAPLMSTAGTSVSQVQDADALVYQPSLLVTTQTAYGWTKDSARTAVLSC